MISKLLETINRDALCARAEALRDGLKCTLNLPIAEKAYFNFDILGGRNYHGSIVFEDGKAWLARFRLPNHNEPPLQERNFDRRSEFATYRFLARTAAPVPEVYDVADDGDPKNPVGAGYILLEKLPGKPLAWHKANETQKGKFSRQLADIYIDLEEHSFNELGRLQLSPTGVLEVGPAFFDYDSKGNSIPCGPFSQSNDYYKTVILRQIQLINSSEIVTSTPSDLYLVYMTLLEHLPPNESGAFFLRHVDSRDANFLVDEEYNITGIIDWELATITTKGSAFQSPLLMYHLGELYHKGLSTPSEDEKRFAKILGEENGAVDLSVLAAQKLYFRLDLVLETDPLEREDFVGLFSGWWKAANKENFFDWDTWREQALEKYGDGGFDNS